MMGIKPACLISVSLKECVELCKAHFMGSGPVAYCIVKDMRGQKQLFIYHKEKLQTVLIKDEIRRCLAEMAYPDDGTAQMYVRLLVKNCKAQKFRTKQACFLGIL